MRGLSAKLYIWDVCYLQLALRGVIVWKFYSVFEYNGERCRKRIFMCIYVSIEHNRIHFKCTKCTWNIRLCIFIKILPCLHTRKVMRCLNISFLFYLKIDLPSSMTTMNTSICLYWHYFWVENKKCFSWDIMVQVCG